MKNISLILFMFVFLSCSNIENLNNNYYYLSEHDAIDVGYPYGSIIYKSEKKNHYDKIIIYSEIKKINHDDNHIIIFQKPKKSLIIKKIIDHLNFWNSYYSEKNKDSLIDFDHKKMSLSEIHILVDNKQSYKIKVIADSIFNNETFYKKMFKNKENYYIIEKATDSVFGPFILKEFEKVKTENKIELNFE